MSPIDSFRNITLSATAPGMQQATSDSLTLIFGVFGTFFAFANVLVVIYQYRTVVRSPGPNTDIDMHIRPASYTHRGDPPSDPEPEHYARYKFHQAQDMSKLHYTFDDIIILRKAKATVAFAVAASAASVFINTTGLFD
ncbi:hypothetical protein O1611_g2989 [Lasiodiplodia mahajangana]|uniref:Uncharacterized protein n=1 Tax=Lasiodiplodia mahajangana TaxID=1108764 RepID=A0ACC2JT11_9PEZI|nr:hypothetical protein O1611_g2989 [Lasiodiplodia mahajangana]